MTEAVRDLGSEVRILRGYGTRNRLLIKIVSVSVAFDVLLSIGLAYGFRTADRASREASKASSTAVVNCRAGNVTRDIQKKLWDQVLSFPPPANETDTDRVERLMRTAQFRDYINTAFAQRDCDHLR
jgi:hypothetical protein